MFDYLGKEINLWSTVAWTSKTSGKTVRTGKVTHIEYAGPLWDSLMIKTDKDNTIQRSPDEVIVIEVSTDGT